MNSFLNPNLFSSMCNWVKLTINYKCENSRNYTFFRIREKIIYMKDPVQNLVIHTKSINIETLYIYIYIYIIISIYTVIHSYILLYII